MAKKIDAGILEHIRLMCYEIVLGEFISQQLRDEVKIIIQMYLNSNNYNSCDIKCNQENNSPEVIDRGQMIIDIFEYTVLCKIEYNHHRIIL